MGVDGHGLSSRGRWLIKCSSYCNEGNHRRIRRAEWLSSSDKHDVGKRQRIAGDMTDKGGSGRTDTVEDIVKEDTSILYYVSTPKLLKIAKEENLAKCRHSKLCHSPRCFGPFSGMLSLCF